jgi:hypothetical protein
VEAEHGEYPPFLIGKRTLSYILDSIIAEKRELRVNNQVFLKDFLQSKLRREDYDLKD